MSRWKSPQAAVKEAEKLRKEKLKSRLMLIGVILLMVASTAAYVVFYAIPRLKNPHRNHHHGAQTNLPAASALPQAGQANQTNHE